MKQKLVQSATPEQKAREGEDLDDHLSCGRRKKHITFVSYDFGKKALKSGIFSSFFDKIPVFPAFFASARPALIPAELIFPLAV